MEVNATTFFERGDQKIYQMKSFPFTSEKARQSVIANDGAKSYIFSKGAPEIMKSLCTPESIPAGYLGTLQKLTGQGLRVIAIAARETDDVILERVKQHLSTKSF